MSAEENEPGKIAPAAPPENPSDNPSNEPEIRSTTGIHEGEQTRAYAHGEVASDEGELLLSGSVVMANLMSMPARLGKYVLKGALGQGGMGMVWKAVDPDLNRTVAIKILSPHLAHSEVARRRFQREAQAVAAISHPNVLTIHSVEVEAGMPFIVMEYVSGDSLREYVNKQGKLTSIEVIRLGTQIAAGLAAAHANGVIHRDIKPANVMLHEGASRVRLMDFGLARVAFDNSDLTSHDHTVGTPAYMAPEQVRGAKVDARADLFGLGCVLYFMIAGHSPFHGKSHAETIHKILDLDPIPLEQAMPGTPALLSDLVTKLLAKNPDDRFQSSQEVADTLRRVQTQLNLAPTDAIVEVLGAKPALKSSEVKNGLENVSLVKASEPSQKSLSGRWFLGAVGFAVFIMVGGIFVWPWVSKGLIGEKDLGNSLISSRKESPEDGKNSAGLVTNPLPKLKRIVVGAIDGADCGTISEALQRADGNCEIHVVGPGPISESIQIDGESKNGIKLVASPRAVWKCPQGNGNESNAVSISNVSGIELSGFDFEVAPELGRAMNLVGTVGDVLINDCTFRHEGPTHRLSLVNIGSKPKDPASRVVLHGCRMRASAGNGFCLAVDSRDGVSPRVDCDGAIFESNDRHVLIAKSCPEFHLTHNIFVGGHTGLHFLFKPWSGDEKFDITNNTFVGTKYWMSWMDSMPAESRNPEQARSRVCNNLILGGERTLGNPDQWNAVIGPWRFESNWWERDDSTQAIADRNGRIASIRERVEIGQRNDSSKSDFVLPEEGSLLLTSGVGGDLPSFIGAKDRGKR